MSEDNNTGGGAPGNRSGDGKIEEIYAGFMVAVLLILTAWGNAIAMFIVSSIGLVAGLAIFRGRSLGGALLAAMIAFIVSFVIAIVLSRQG